MNNDPVSINTNQSNPNHNMLHKRYSVVAQGPFFGLQGEIIDVRGRNGNEEVSIKMSNRVVKSYSMVQFLLALEIGMVKEIV